MEFNDLIDFIDNRMKMSHIYQPLLLRILVEAGGTATIRQLAHAFLAQDESQLRFYESRIKQMPVPVLKRRGVISNDGQLVRLTCKKLDFEQKAQIIMSCEKRLQQFIMDRGLNIWGYRLLDTDPVPGSLRYRVLKESGGRCANCGATKKERPLDVDHIIPRSKGGRNVYENLQVLCSLCNQEKGNKDSTACPADVPPDSVSDCKFCYQSIKGRILEESDAAVAIKDRYPVTEGHTLVIPKRHAPEYFDLSNLERRDVDGLLKVMKQHLFATDPSITGYNIGINNGASAGQTIFHVHFHLIPRRNGDTADPRGGVRCVIPGKRSY
jgi:diadenosine tetraphosphate (Ap4A) HIT family hydrolase